MRDQLFLAGMILAMFFMAAIFPEKDSGFISDSAGGQKYRISYDDFANTSQSTREINTYNITFKLKKHSSVKLELPVSWKIHEQAIRQLLIEIHDTLEDLVGVVQLKDLRISLIDQNKFFSTYQAPSWVKALYVNNSIKIPIGADFNIKDTLSSIRHEYVHAYVRVAGLGRCPVWLDEGLAQILENDREALAQLEDHVKSNRATSISLLNLEGSFTTLPVDKVAEAYARSYQASVKLVALNQAKLKIYFALLREGVVQRDAFKMAFSNSIYSFNKSLRS